MNDKTRVGVVIKILQVVYGVRWANCISCSVCAKNYESWLALDKVIAAMNRLTFWPTLYVGKDHWSSLAISSRSWRHGVS